MVKFGTLYYGAVIYRNYVNFLYVGLVILTEQRFVIRPQEYQL